MQCNITSVRIYIFVYSSCSIKAFSDKTSTGNLKNHLKSDHNITDATVSLNSTKNIQTFFIPKPRNDAMVTVTDAKKKRSLVIDIVLMCCKDLLPFSITHGTGLRDFCMVSSKAILSNFFLEQVSFGLAKLFLIIIIH